MTVPSSDTDDVLQNAMLRLYRTMKDVPPGSVADFLRLAAGGFRALTRLSGRAAGIWPDICVENRAAIVEVLDRYVAELQRCGIHAEATDDGTNIGTLAPIRAPVSVNTAAPALID